MGINASKVASVVSSYGPNVAKQLKSYVDDLEAEEDDFKVEEVDIHLRTAAAKFDPTKFRKNYMKTHPGISEEDAAALEINPAEWKFPFENIVLEGGGQKGLAYVGVIKAFEDLGIMSQLKRVGGTSAGGMSAALVALGYNSEELLGFLSQDLTEILNDHSCGYCSILPNIMKSNGWNPGKRVFEWFGKAIEYKTGDPDTTFYDLYKETGMELCIVVTNLNLLSVEYCHAKTTPDMPIRVALRMTMAIPLVFSSLEYESHGQRDTYVDGGVLNNYPINCFDGWYLSMKKEDAFLLKLSSLNEFPELLANENRFKSTGPNKTVGVLLFEELERDVMRFRLEGRVGSLQPRQPAKDTPLWLEKKKKWDDMDRAQKTHTRIVNAVDLFLKVLRKHNLDDVDFISREELKAVLEDSEFDDASKQVIFGKDINLYKAFKILDRNGDNKIGFFELMTFIQERGVRMQIRFSGLGRREVTNFASFVNALQESLLTNLKYIAVTVHDEERTVGINVGHIGTLDYTMAIEDRDFCVERGYNATIAYLRYFVAEHPELVTERNPVLDQQPQPTSL